MAQDSSLRHLRSDPPHARESAPASDDPLAELARLIGQNDPFAETGGRDTRSRPAAERPPAAAAQEAPEWLSRPAGAPSQGGADPGSYDQAGYQDPNYAYQDDPNYQDPRYQAEHQAAYAEGSADDPNYGYQSEAYYDDQQGYEDGAYEAPPEKRRGGLMTVAAVVVLAVVGTAAAYGYRTWSSHSGTSGEPPVIKAEQTPTKVVPAAPGNESQLKQVYERAGDRGGERVVPREEQPIDPRSAAPRQPAQASQNVLPPLGGAAPVPTAAGDAKPVRTMTIRPDQAGIAAAQPQANQPATRPLAAVTPPPAAVRVPTQPIQSAPPRPESGGYLVQVSSQRSETEAQTSFRVLQQKYPAVLGSHKASIRRVDIPEKGTFFRANIGPFASAEEANEVCGSLKQAGGQCLVARN